MFTGVIGARGMLQSIATGKKGSKRLEIKAPAHFKSRPIGSSVAVQGVCLTVVRKKGSSLYFDVVRETLRRSTLGLLVVGDRVHLERPLEWKGRVEGHFVLGHVDAMGKVVQIQRVKSDASMKILFPKNLKRYVREKGSIAVDGVSLTLGKVSAQSFWIHLIPHTLKMTNFGSLRAGDPVNLEMDFLLRSNLNKQNKRSVS